MNTMLILGAIGPTEIILIVVVIVLLFGGKKIPELMKGLGQGIKEFKNASKTDNASTHSKETEVKNNPTLPESK